MSYDHLFRLTFNSPQVPILAVITKDPIGSMVSYFGTGSTQGRVKHRLAHKAEFCYAPSMSEISVSKTAIYATGMQPGTASWTFAKSVELAPPYTNNRATMFNGDSVDATWTLAAQKVGADVSYQGVVSGTITINNPTPAVVTVTSIIDQVTGGPAATVTCPVGTPFTVPACSFATCQYTAYYPAAPPPGAYTSAAQVQFQVMGSQGYPSMVQGTTVFNVGVVGAAPTATAAGLIPAGQAMVTDTQAPQGSYMFSGPGSQAFQTQVTCGGASTSGAVSNTAVMTAANGQQVTQSATVQKQCYDLQVSVASKAAPYVGRWGWAVTKTASPATLRLRPDAKALGGASAVGSDYASTTSGDVVYSVTYTRSPPAGFVSGTPAFEASGEVIVQNPAPVAARLQSVLVSISNSRGGSPYVTEATCPLLNVGGGQRITCQWRATPTFNPVGQQVRGIARYINLRNGEPRGATTDFTSAPATINGGSADAGSGDAAGARRALLQTWGHATATVAGAPLPELEPEPAVATTLYGVDGSAIVVPNTVANGSGVVVSGDGLAAAGMPIVAGAAQGTPVVLPSQLTAGAHGAFVNEAGPGQGAGEASVAALSGLQDECVDVADTFLTGSGTVEGALVSGTPPSGRICSTTTFTYTMRYGPYGDCQPRKSVNAATFQTVDTQTRGSCQSDLAIAVEGCVNPAALKITPLRLNTTGGSGYTWAVTKRADQAELALGQDATAIVTYTVDVKRVGAKAGMSMLAEVAVSNPTPYPVPVEGATYTATTMCADGGKTTSGPVVCDADAVPAHGKIVCKVNAAVPCAGAGAYTVVLTSSGGVSVTSVPTPFAFDSAAIAAKSSGECADVKDVFLAGSGRVGGALVSGVRPNGRLCGSKTFTYAVRFGPHRDCMQHKVGVWLVVVVMMLLGWGGGPTKREGGEGCSRVRQPPLCSLPHVNLIPLPPTPNHTRTSTHTQAVNTITVRSNGTTKVTGATHTLPITVVGCDLYTAEATGAKDCVKPAKWWPLCDVAKDAKCAAGWKLLPGGAGKSTLFFPKPHERSARTYGAMFLVPDLAAVGAAKKAYLEAAQQFMAAQLNFLSGARLPSIELHDSYDALASFLATTGEGGAANLSDDQVAAVGAAAGLLGKYNNGTLPAGFKAPPLCA